MSLYSFDHQMARGDEGAAFLDDFFREKGYAIRDATRDEQRAGIDRAFTNPRSGKVSLVEYKTDTRAADQEMRLSKRSRSTRRARWAGR
jgi:hypothetical protein